MKKITFCFLVILLAAACSASRPTNFYSLTSVKDEAVKINNTKKLVVGIDYVSIPGYLERPQIVTIKNDGDTELKLAEFDRWAEPLANSLQRIIAGNMSFYLKNSIVKPSGASRRGYDYIVSVEMNRFDGKFNDKLVLDSWWTIIDSSGKMIVNEHSVFESGLGGSYDDLVMKQSGLISRLSAEIAKKINKLK